MATAKIIKTISGLSFLFFVMFAWQVSAQVMQSSNYRMQKDSINIGGTEDAFSDDYNLRDTLGELATGESESTNFGINAGYRQMEETYLSMSVPSSIVLTPGIGGITGGTANGSGTWNVKTDAEAGYKLYIKATNSPAMIKGVDSFADYTPVSALTPDYAWDISNANSEFGFSPYNSVSQVNKFRNNGSVCNAGSSISDGGCWYGLSTSNEEIVYKTSRTESAGEDTKINFRAELNSSSGFQVAGEYTATVVVTAVNN